MIHITVRTYLCTKFPELLTYLLAYLLMELNSSCEVANCADIQEFPSILWNPRVHYRVHKSPPLVPNPSQIDKVPTIPSHPIYLRSILILSTHLRLGLPSGLFPSGFPSNILYAFASSLFVPHALPISSSLTWSFCLARSTSYEAPHYAVSSNLPSLHL
jgi:hypothetical protein